MWSYLIKAFQADGLKPPRVTVRTNSYHTRYSLLATGRFVSVRASFALEFQGKQALVKALPIELPMTLAPLAIMTLKNRTISPVAQLFIEHAREVARSLVKRG